MPIAPAGSLDRLVDAYRSAVVLLPDNFAALNAELLRPDTELTIAALLSVWSGFDVPGLGWLSGPMAESKDAVQLGPAGPLLDQSVASAIAARDPAQAKAAGEAIAKALTLIGATKLGALIRSSQFSQLRAALQDYRGQLLTGRPWTAKGGESAKETVVPISAPSPASGLWWVGGVAVTVMAVIALARAKRRTNG